MFILKEELKNNPIKLKEILEQYSYIEKFDEDDRAICSMSTFDLLKMLSNIFENTDGLYNYHLLNLLKSTYSVSELTKEIVKNIPYKITTKENHLSLELTEKLFGVKVIVVDISQISNTTTELLVFQKAYSVETAKQIVKEQLQKQYNTSFIQIFILDAFEITNIENTIIKL